MTAKVTLDRDENWEQSSGPSLSKRVLQLANAFFYSGRPCCMRGLAGVEVGATDTFQPVGMTCELLLR